MIRPFNFLLVSCLPLPLPLYLPQHLPLLNSFNSIFSITMPKSKNSGPSFYAVAVGKVPGIYHDWPSCLSQVHKYPNAKFKKFTTAQMAEEFIQGNNKNAAINQNVIKSRLAPIIIAEKTIPPAKRTIPKSTILLETPTRIRAPPPKRLKIDDSESDPYPIPTPTKTYSFTLDPTGYCIVYTDGACTANGRNGARAGIGVWFGEGHGLNSSSRVTGRQTNNTAEIQAAVKAILIAKSAGLSKLLIKTDSSFLINCITKWINSWKRNGWKLSNGENVKNREELEELEKSMINVHVKWEHVRGHSGERGNEMADLLARKGAEMDINLND